MNLGDRFKPVRTRRDLGVIMHKSDTTSMIQCAEAKGANRVLGI